MKGMIIILSCWNDPLMWVSMRLWSLGCQVDAALVHDGYLKEVNDETRMSLALEFVVGNTIKRQRRCKRWQYRLVIR
ncbi:hypothetical protein PIB30_031323 [Stylosanthes scabra]|uniref:Uncharacterized protein n=1 Tax=Stylosanthes scabra TaxID=79078 RepID=A0ABU6SBQ0_9FABA|nr:hypothetical protein [Stylosanthes scabra]